MRFEKNLNVVRPSDFQLLVDVPVVAAFDDAFGKRRPNTRDALQIARPGGQHSLDRTKLRDQSLPNERSHAGDENQLQLPAELVFVDFMGRISFAHSARSLNKRANALGLQSQGFELMHRLRL